MAEEEAPKAWSFADQNKDEQAVALAALVLDQCGEGEDKFAPEKFARFKDPFVKNVSVKSCPW